MWPIYVENFDKSRVKRIKLRLLQISTLTFLLTRNYLSRLGPLAQTNSRQTIQTQTQLQFKITSTSYYVFNLVISGPKARTKLNLMWASQPTGSLDQKHNQNVNTNFTPKHLIYYLLELVNCGMEVKLKHPLF